MGDERGEQEGAPPFPDDVLGQMHWAVNYGGMPTREKLDEWLRRLREERVWRPIETAPKGEHLLYFPEHRGRNAMAPMTKVDYYPVLYPRKPTHWMPLPAPPSPPPHPEEPSE